MTDAARRLTPGQADELLGNMPGRDAVARALRKADDRGLSEARAARDAAHDAIQGDAIEWEGARRAACAAAVALHMRGVLNDADYGELTTPWRRIVGPIHPDDPEPEGVSSVRARTDELRLVRDIVLSHLAEYRDAEFTASQLDALIAGKVAHAPGMEDAAYCVAYATIDGWKARAAVG